MSPEPPFDSQNDTHRRFNPLLSDWVLVSPHRAQRPWSGQVERPVVQSLPMHDPGCYLCPGNVRASGQVNPNYTSTFVFKNDFSAMVAEGVSGPKFQEKMFVSQPVAGECRVVCFSPRHDLTLAQMEAAEIRAVVDLWMEQVAELQERYAWVQVFENKGEAMGCSNPHPHGQIWASDALPATLAREEPNFVYYHQELGRNLLLDIVNAEIERGERVIETVGDWVAWVPFWACWPFELLLAPKRPIASLLDLDFPLRMDLAEILRRLLARYDNLFETSFPYSMGWHFAPPRREGREAWQLHAHFYPPLLRSASVRKFMVGYEMLAEPQRDLTPEQAADRLRAVSSIHYARNS